MIIAIVLPLIALVFGTSALGSELEEGTIVYLLAKPVRRLRIVLAKVVVAAALTAALIVPSTLLTGAVATFGGNELMGPATAYAIAAALGGAAYVVVFLALSTFTRWALAIGLVYVLLWEGILADLLPGTQHLLGPPGARINVAGDLRRAAGSDGSLEQGLFVLCLIIARRHRPRHLAHVALPAPRRRLTRPHRCRTADWPPPRMAPCRLARFARRRQTRPHHDRTNPTSARTASSGPGVAC